VNGADIGWMIVATGMVLLMTPALAFFLRGLVRSKNALNTMMMSFGRSRSSRRLGARRLLAGVRPRQRGDRRDPARAVERRRPRREGRDPSRPVHGLPGDVRGDHGRAGFGGESSSGCVFRPTSSSSACGASSSTRRWRTGCGRRWLSTRGILDFAGGTVVHVNAGVAALVRRPRPGARRDHGRQAFLPHNVPLVLLGTACSGSGGSASTAQRPPPPTTSRRSRPSTRSSPDGDRARVDAPRHLPHEADDRGRRGDGDRRRPGRGHAGGGFRRAALGAHDRRHRGASFLLRDPLALAHGGSTTRSTSPRPTAWAASWALCSPAFSRARRGEASMD